jgi:hypothetical protein
MRSNSMSMLSDNYQQMLLPRVKNERELQKNWNSICLLIPYYPSFFQPGFFQYFFSVTAVDLSVPDKLMCSTDGF